MRDPEGWLRKSGLIKLIKSEQYQVQLSKYLGGAVTFGNKDMQWSHALLMTRNWLEMLFSTGYFDNIDGTNWAAAINQEIAHLIDYSNGTNRYEVADCVFFWIAQYSLLKALVDKRINIKSDCAKTIFSTYQYTINSHMERINTQ